MYIGHCIIFIFYFNYHLLYLNTFFTLFNKDHNYFQIIKYIKLPAINLTYPLLSIKFKDQLLKIK